MQEEITQLINVSPEFYFVLKVLSVVRFCRINLDDTELLFTQRNQLHCPHILITLTQHPRLRHLPSKSQIMIIWGSFSVDYTVIHFVSIRAKFGICIVVWQRPWV
jgi:hypothetical protein